MLVIKMRSKCRFPLESLSRSLPRAVLYQPFLGLNRASQKRLLGKCCAAHAMRAGAPALPAIKQTVDPEIETDLIFDDQTQYGKR